MIADAVLCFVETWSMSVEPHYHSNSALASGAQRAHPFRVYVLCQMQRMGARAKGFPYVPQKLASAGTQAVNR